jgi:fatty-acyl-CoA synthase
MTAEPIAEYASVTTLSPLAFLGRAVRMFGDRIAVIDGDDRLTYTELGQRVGRKIAALVELGVRRGDRVAVLAPNGTAMLEAHYCVPGAGAVLLALNTRLTERELRQLLLHSGASLLIVDPNLDGFIGDRAIPTITTEEFHRLAGSHQAVPPLVMDEFDLLAINYTSGTTGLPKGVMYHHRGAYLQSLAVAFHTRLRPGSVYLWTLPMFHCNGWCYTWAVTAAGGTHLCLPRIEPDRVWQHLLGSGVTHFNAAPTVLSMLADSPAAVELPRSVFVGTGGAPPSPALLERMSDLRFDVQHMYGLTETFGPVVVCDWQPEWDALPLKRRAALKARQGNSNVLSSELRIVDDENRAVSADGETQGEVQIRGNNVMLGYFEDAEATVTAFAPGGWFRTGDLGVMHPGGYFELRDRAKDVIISGGENIASVEVEQSISTHPAVLEAAVVARSHSLWGEVPIAYVSVKTGAEVTDGEIIAHVRSQLAGFKAPKGVVFGELPRTSTGKVQKHRLRRLAQHVAIPGDPPSPVADAAVTGD